jgi:hypothetical protein
LKIFSICFICNDRHKWHKLAACETTNDLGMMRKWSELLQKKFYYTLGV